jgi:glycerol-3-phosphate O-acyltransferase
MNERQLATALRGYVDYARRRALPRVASAEVDDPATLASVLGSLVEHGVVTRSGDAEPRYAVAPGRELWAAYYRNTVVHHFVPAAVAELALLAAAESPGAVEATFFATVRDLHALLAADFHLVDATRFAERVADELESEAPDWRERLAADPRAAVALLERAPVLCSDLMLRPIFEAHAIVGEWLAGRAPASLPDDSVALAQCMRAGAERLRRGTVKHPEAVAMPLLAAALRHARRRDAVTAAVPRWLESMNAVHRIAVERVTAMLDARALRT